MSLIKEHKIVLIKTRNSSSISFFLSKLIKLQDILPFIQAGIEGVIKKKKSFSFLNLILYFSCAKKSLR